MNIFGNSETMIKRIKEMQPKNYTLNHGMKQKSFQMLMTSLFNSKQVNKRKFNDFHLLTFERQG